MAPRPYSTLPAPREVATRVTFEAVAALGGVGEAGGTTAETAPVIGRTMLATGETPRLETKGAIGPTAVSGRRGAERGNATGATSGTPSEADVHHPREGGDLLQEETTFATETERETAHWGSTPNGPDAARGTARCPQDHLTQTNRLFLSRTVGAAFVAAAGEVAAGAESGTVGVAGPGSTTTATVTAAALKMGGGGAAIVETIPATASGLWTILALREIPGTSAILAIATW